MKTKTIKTPLMMAEVFDLTSCPSSFVPKSELLHKPEEQYSLVSKLIHHGGKNIALCAKQQSKTLYKGFSQGDCPSVRELAATICTSTPLPSRGGAGVGSVLCFSGSSEPVFLLFSGYNPNGVDGVAEGFYLGACTQGKAFGHNIKDEVLT